MLALPSNAQQPVLQWAKEFFGTDAYINRDLSNGRSIGVDAKGNVYTVGLFMHTVDFDPGAGVFTITGGGQFNYGIYISKLSPAGDFVWAEQLPILVDWSAIEMQADKEGNVYVTSTIGAPADMDPGPGVQMMTPIGPRDAFVVKLDTDGNFVWAKQFGGPGDTAPYGTTIDVDQNGNVIACGEFNNTVDFDPGPGTFNMTATGNFEGYIVKLSSNGDLIWAKKFGNFVDRYGSVSIGDVKCDPSGDIYTTGVTNEPCDFDPGPNSFIIPGSGGFVTKLDPNGNFLWAKKVGSSENNQYIQPFGLDLDSKNNVYTIGTFSGTQDFGVGTSVYNMTSIGGTFDPYLLKMDSNGNFVWAKDLGGDGLDYGYALVIDNADNIYTGGDYNGSVDFDPGPGVFKVDNLYDNNALCKFDNNGNFVYAAVFDGYLTLRKLAADNLHNVFATGFFGGTADFDPGPAQYMMTSSMDESPFVLKIGPCKNITTDTLNITTCKNYSLNNTTFDSSGSYTIILPNSYGCDSIITLNLTVNRLSDTVRKTICEGETYFAGGADQSVAGIYNDTLKTNAGCDSILITYLSVNPKPKPYLGPGHELCEGGQLSITPGTFSSYLWQDGSTGSAFLVNAAGLYWVQVTDGVNCSAIDSVTFSIRPNPKDFLKPVDSVCTNEKLQIQSLKTFKDYLWSTGNRSPAITVSTPGIYSLTVTDDNGCSGADTVTVFAKDCYNGVYLPNAFTPNGDEKNDVFRPFVFGTVTSYFFAVYNRFGQLIFQTKEPGAGWDGTVRGRPQDSDVFLWVCNYQLQGATPVTERGSFLLIR